MEKEPVVDAMLDAALVSPPDQFGGALFGDDVAKHTANVGEPHCHSGFWASRTILWLTACASWVRLDRCSPRSE